MDSEEESADVELQSRTGNNLRVKRECHLCLVCSEKVPGWTCLMPSLSTIYHSKEYDPYSVLLRIVGLSEESIIDVIGKDLIADGITFCNDCVFYVESALDYMFRIDALKKDLEAVRKKLVKGIINSRDVEKRFDEELQLEQQEVHIRDVVRQLVAQGCTDIEIRLQKCNVEYLNRSATLRQRDKQKAASLGMEYESSVGDSDVLVYDDDQVSIKVESAEKRKPGRPRKHPLNLNVSKTPKRKPGRPRKIQNNCDGASLDDIRSNRKLVSRKPLHQFVTTSSLVKRKRGRPPKLKIYTCDSDTDQEREVKRKPGRPPRFHHEYMEINEPVAQKRRPGRPCKKISIQSDLYEQNGNSQEGLDENSNQEVEFLLSDSTYDQTSSHKSESDDDYRPDGSVALRKKRVRTRGRPRKTDVENFSDSDSKSAGKLGSTRDTSSQKTIEVNECAFCSTSFASPSFLQLHMAESHPAISLTMDPKGLVFTCSECKTKFDSEISKNSGTSWLLNNDDDVRIEVNTFGEFCDDHYKRCVRNLVHNRRPGRPKKSRPKRFGKELILVNGVKLQCQQCDFCPRSFATPSLLHLHALESHPDSSAAKFPPVFRHSCRFCDYVLDSSDPTCRRTEEGWSFPEVEEDSDVFKSFSELCNAHFISCSEAERKRKLEEKPKRVRYRTKSNGQQCQSVGIGWDHVELDCSACDKKFMGETLLHVHASESHLNSSEDTSGLKFTCIVCKYELISSQYKNSLGVWQLSVEDDRTYDFNTFADFCNAHFVACRDSQNKRRRGRKPKPRPPPVQSKKRKYCKRVLTNLDSVVNGMKKCQVCFQTFPIGPRLKYHMRIHSQPKICVVCAEKCTSDRGLAIHLSRAHKLTWINGSYFACHDCMELYNNTKDNTSSTNNEAGDPQVNQTRLKEFIESHQNCKKAAASTCNLCNKYTASNARSLLMHFILNHEKNRSFFCDQCGKSFAFLGHLNEHMLKVHTNERRYKCTECPFTSKFHSHLTDHVRSHTGEKPYICDICGAKWASTSALAKHRQIHNTERNVPCQICGKLFKRYHDMYNHVYSTHKNKRKPRQTARDAPLPVPEQHFSGGFSGHVVPQWPGYSSSFGQPP